MFRTAATLDLKINAFAGLIQSQIGQLASTLTLLDLSANMFTGTLPTEIGNLVALTDLRVAKSDTSPNPDGSCPSGCLSGALPTELGRLVNLKILWLFENSFTGMLPSEFGKLEKLTECLLYSNSIEGEIPKAFSNLKNLGEFLKYRFPNRVAIDVHQLCGANQLFRTNSNPRPVHQLLRTKSTGGIVQEEGFTVLISRNQCI